MSQIRTDITLIWNFCREYLRDSDDATITYGNATKAAAVATEANLTSAVNRLKTEFGRKTGNQPLGDR